MLWVDKCKFTIGYLRGKRRETYTNKQQEPEQNNPMENLFECVCVRVSVHVAGISNK